MVAAGIGAPPFKLLALMMLHALGAATVAPIYAAFQARAEPSARALAAVAPVALGAVIGLFIGPLSPPTGVAFMISALALATAAVICLGGPKSVRALLRP